MMIDNSISYKGIAKVQLFQRFAKKFFTKNRNKFLIPTFYY